MNEERALAHTAMCMRSCDKSSAESGQALGYKLITKWWLYNIVLLVATVVVATGPRRRHVRAHVRREGLDVL